LTCMWRSSRDLAGGFLATWRLVVELVTFQQLRSHTMLPLSVVKPSGPPNAKQTTLSFVTTSASRSVPTIPSSHTRSGGRTVVTGCWLISVSIADASSVGSGASTSPSKESSRLIRVEMPVPTASRPSRPETYDPDAALAKFGIAAFRPQQREAVTSILSGTHAFIMSVPQMWLKHGCTTRAGRCCDSAHRRGEVVVLPAPSDASQGWCVRVIANKKSFTFQGCYVRCHSHHCRVTVDRVDARPSRQLEP
jgi:hypothetical protein